MQYNNLRVADYKVSFRSLKIHLHPMDTFYLYYCYHFSKIHSVIQTFDDDDAASIKTAKKYLKKSNLPCQLTFIKANFEFLPRAITFLEKRGTKLDS